jgi:hypothetical protein
VKQPDGQAGNRRPGRARAGRAGFLGAGMLAVALATACSSAPSGSTAQSQSAHGQALAYAQCMRSHGVSDFPDPNNQGRVFLQGSGIDPGSPQFQSAQKACLSLDKNIGIQSPAQHAQQVTQALNYANCMRSHGITDFPDPPSSGQATVNLKTLGIDPSSPRFLNAQQACRKYSPA